MALAIYWYISGAKVKALNESLSKGSFLKEVSIKLKSPWIEVGGSIQPNAPSQIRELEKVKKRIQSELHVPAFPSFSDNETPLVFSFKGKAARMVSQGRYWVAMEEDDSALLLGGSASHAIGQQSTQGDDWLSPSLDPVGALSEAFRTGGSGQQLSSTLSYAWQAIMGSQLDSGMILPMVEGLAVFASTVPADLGYMTRVGRENISHLVIGSPIYIRQV